MYLVSFILCIPFLFYLYHKRLIKKNQYIKKRTYKKEIHSDCNKCVVFIHGTTGSSNNFDDIIDKLPKNIHYISYDLYGRGLSIHKYMEHDINLYVNQLHEIIKEIDNKKEIHLVGYSYGGLIAHEYKKKNPDRIRSIVLVAPAGMNTNIGYFFELLCILPNYILMPIAHVFGKYLLEYQKILTHSNEIESRYNYPLIASCVLTMPRKKYIYNKNMVHLVIYGTSDNIVRVPKETISENVYVLDANHSNILYNKETLEILQDYFSNLDLYQ